MLTLPWRRLPRRLTMSAAATSLTAGASAYLIAGSGTNATLNAAEDAYAVVMGTGVITAIAGRDAGAWASGVLGGAVHADRDAAPFRWVPRTPP